MLVRLNTPEYKRLQPVNISERGRNFIAYSKSLLPVYLLFCCHVILVKANGQIPGIPNIQTPQPATFEQTGLKQFTSPGIKTISPASIFEQQRDVIQQRNLLIYQQDLHNSTIDPKQRVLQQLREEEQWKQYDDWLAGSKAYCQAFNYLDKLNPDSFSLSKAVFAVENAFFDNRNNYGDFERVLKLRAELVKQILKRENLSAKNNLALNYGIIKMYRQYNSYYDRKTKHSISVKPFSYDFEDFMGQQDYTKVFTSKLLATGKGQCHSLPLLYLMIAEQLGAKAWLSLAPQHSFIQFMDKNNNLLNFETTNGSLVSSNWLQQSGYINANALKARTYMDTLSQRRLYALCLTDLLLGYESKFGYDNFTEQVRQKIVQTDPGNLAAALMEARLKTMVAIEKITAAGKPAPEDLPKYPEAYQAWQQMQEAYE